MASIYAGPFVGMFCGVMADLIGAAGWVPQLAVAPLLMGLLPGLLLRLFPRKMEQYPFLTLLIVCLVANLVGPILTTTYFLSGLYGMPFWPLFVARALQYVLMAVLESVLLCKLLPLMDRPVHKDALTYEDALNYISGIYWRGSKLGLQRTQELLGLLGNPEKKLKFVHVAGTNGKGSTSAMLASVLRASGYRTGLYTSPYINRFNERMIINGKPIGDGELARIVSYVKPFAESMHDLPTEFELITAIAMVYFLRHRCDIVVLEVGLGGAMDSTNVIPVPEVAVITAMGMDHTAILGDTMPLIASAKAGIIKTGCDVVTYGENDEADAVFVRTCEDRSAQLHKTDFSSLSVSSYSLEGQTFSFGEHHGLYLPLLGRYQTKNAAVVLTVLDVLKQKGYHISERAIRSGLSHTVWPARFELLHKEPIVIVDGGHNPHGVAATVESIRTLLKDQKVLFVMGVMADKEVAGILELMLPVAERFYAVTPDNPRSLPAETLAEKIRAAGGEARAYACIRDGLIQAIHDAGKHHAVVAAGSLYLAGDIRRLVKEYYHG